MFHAFDDRPDVRGIALDVSLGRLAVLGIVILRGISSSPFHEQSPLLLLATVVIGVNEIECVLSAIDF